MAIGHVAAQQPSSRYVVGTHRTKWPSNKNDAIYSIHMCCGCGNRCMVTVTGYETTEHITYMTGFTHSWTDGRVCGKGGQSNKLN